MNRVQSQGTAALIGMVLLSKAKTKFARLHTGQKVLDVVRRVSQCCKENSHGPECSSQRDKVTWLGIHGCLKAFVGVV